MKKSNILYLIIGGAINILCTVFLPDFFISLFNLGIQDKILAIIIGSVILLILFLLKLIIFPSTNEFDSLEIIQQNNRDYKRILKIREIHTLRIYSISSAYWNDIFSKFGDLKIDQCIIMVRNDKRLASEPYNNELCKAIKKWKEMVENKKQINHLVIIEYDNIPDINYVIIDNIALICGLNLFCENDSTFQRGDRTPIHIYGNNKIKCDFINKYIEHFNNYNKYYGGNVIFDSNSPKEK